MWRISQTNLQLSDQFARQTVGGGENVAVADNNSSADVFRGGGLNLRLGKGEASYQGDQSA